MASERRTSQLNTHVEYLPSEERRTSQLGGSVEYQLSRERRFSQVCVMIEIGYTPIVYGHAGPKVQIMS